MPPKVVAQGGAVDAVALDRLLPKMVAMLRGMSRTGKFWSIAGIAAFVILAMDGTACPKAAATRVKSNKV
jgi:hypothetical protein